MSDAGVDIVTLWETTGTDITLYDINKGLSDARNAILNAQLLGQHPNTPIYFCVDVDLYYDDNSSDPGFTEYLDFYMMAVVATLNSNYNTQNYLFGVYGCNDVCRRYHETYGAYTMLWGANYYGNNTFTNWNIHQHYPDVTISPGFVIDPDEIIPNKSYGGWRHSFPSTWTYMSSTYHKRTCTSCHYVYKQAHEYPEAWSSYGNNNYHRKVCTASGCGAVKYESHTVNHWVNYGNSARHRGVCSSCGQTVYKAHVPNAAGTKCTVCGYEGNMGGTTKDSEGGYNEE